MQNLINAIVNYKKCHFPLFLLLIILLTSLTMTFYSPLYPGIDPYFHLNRLLALMEALKDGSFPFYLDYNSINGYGYFTKAFYCDFLLIPFALVGNITNVMFAYKSLLFTCYLGSGIATYFSIKRIYQSEFTAIVASVLYTFCIYINYQSFYCAFISESMTFMFIPLAFWGLFEIIRGDYNKWYILTIAYCLIMFTHFITMILLFIIMLVFIVCCYKDLIKEPRRVKYLFLSGGICIIMSSYYLFPMLEQMFDNTYYYQTKPIIDISYHKVLFSDLIHDITMLLPNLQYHVLRPKLGGLLLLMVFLRFFIFDKSQQIKSIDLGVLIGLFFIYANTYFFPWSIAPFSKLEFIQFPWRLFKYSSFFFAVAGGFYLNKLLKGNYRKVLLLSFLVMLTIVISKYDSDSYKQFISGQPTNITEKTIAENAVIGGGEYLPSKIPSKEFLSERKYIVAKQNENIQVLNYKKEKGNISLDLKIESSDKLELPLTYYKGYAATLNGNKLQIEQSDNGLIELPITQSGYVEVWYEGTVIQKISPYISLISLILLCVYLYIRNRKMKPAK